MQFLMLAHEGVLHCVLVHPVVITLSGEVTASSCM
jgi:hypothetical protein